MSNQQLDSALKRLENVTSRLEALSNQKPALPPKPANASGSNISAAASSQVPAVVNHFDDQVEEPIRAFLTVCKNIGGDVSSMGEKVKVTFELLKNYIWFAAGQAKPTDDVLQQKQKPIGKLLEEIGEMKESKRNTQFFNHLSAIAEGINAVSWINVSPTPAPFVKESLDASMFFVNRVRSEHKTNQLHSDWAKGWIDVLESMQKYIRQHHTTGLTWNSTPGSAPPASGPIGSAPSKPSSGPPGPPPPPPVDFLAEKKAPSQSDADNSARQALFNDLNKGEGVTSRLKKVTSDMQTHKNPELRGQSTVPAKSANANSSAPAAAKTVQEKPPKTELQDFKTWIVEYHKGNRNIVIEIADMKQTVYVFRCENSVVQIKGKVNSVTIDGCKKTSVVVDNLLSQVEVINSQSIEVQTLGTMPTVSIQKTDGCQVYLSKDSMKAEIVTSKSSEMNILAPNGDDFIELPVPEQFKTVFNAGTKKLETTVSDIV
ncbi:Adenylyl cyclase-associated protein [Aphelenchoides bicaudatus]|nr:Adenylyl cyclase-associated protein [Aphelenchoides bicaudatus]